MRPSDPAYGLERYEDLRQQALDPAASGRRGLGLALFLSRGMGAWLAALSALEPPPPQPSSRDGERSGPLVPASQRAELVTVLAGMVMACNEEVRP